MIRLYACFALATLTAAAGAAPLQTFEVKDYLGHTWADELIHFDFSVATSAKDLTLADEAGKPVLCQFTDLQRAGGKVSGKVWTVLSLPPNGSASLQLVAGKPPATGLRLTAQGQEYVLSNEFLSLRLPKLPGTLPQPMALASLPAPLLALAGPEARDWLGTGTWVSPDPGLQVKQALTSVVEQGPIRITVRYRLTFTEGKFYQAEVSLGDRQDCALFTDDSDVEAPPAGFRLNLEPGLRADRLYWRNNYYADMTKGLTPGPVAFDQEQIITKLCPWSFWWLKDQTTWAGFYRDGADPFVGVIALRPSCWSPTGWGGFDRTAIPLTAHPGGQLDMTLGLLALTEKKADGTPTLTPLHRELAFTVGAAEQFVTKDDSKAKLRRQLIKYSEFPLDQVKDYHFDFKPAQPDRKHPFLFFTDKEVERVRRQAQTVPSVKQTVEADINYILNGCGSKRTLENEGPEAYYTKNYIGNYQVEKLPEAYMGSEDPIFGKLLAAAVVGITQNLLDTFLEKPTRPAIGAYGPWFSATVTRLITNYDLIAGKGLLTPEEEARARAALVFGAHVLAHPDYWNTDVGLCSANPNMTSSILLPRGLCALLLDGHPRCAEWLEGAERQFKRELKDWIHPGGAWIECPGYQAASLDGEFLLAQALKNVLGRDYFLDPQFQATMNYYGFLLTPPDQRFPTESQQAAHPQAPMVIPSIGDMFSGWITCYNGWMACATAKTDPAFSARQQFYWKMQNCYLGMAGRAQGMTLALTDPELPATPPAELSAAFPGFGSVMRTSWTDPLASYLCHRTGPTLHHYHNDHGEIIYAAKGATLCTDFGNCYAPVQRSESWYHNRVSFEIESSPVKGGTSGELKETRFLPRTVDYSFGESNWGGNGKDQRHLLLVKSADPLGANYVVVRDTCTTTRTQGDFYWNLWCLSTEPQIAKGLVHFPGQQGVDLDVHVLSPADPQIDKDHWGFEQQIYVWGPFKEDQWAMRIAKQGNPVNFLCLLYPRAAGQGEAQVTALADGAALQLGHMEGTDAVLLSPGKPAQVSEGDFRLSGEIALARKYNDGRLRLACVKSAQAATGDWGLNAPGPAGVEIVGTDLRGESSGDAQKLVLTLSGNYGDALVTVDSKPVSPPRQGRELTLDLPAGTHVFTVQKK
jgi:hypothetical protein